MKNEAAILEISNQSIQKLVVRNLYKMEEFKGKISDNLKVIKEKYDTLYEADSKLKNISNLVGKYMKLMSDEGLETNDNKSNELLESGKTITKIINGLADMIEDIERMKAEREETEYDFSGSIAEKFKNFSLSDISKSMAILKEAKNLIQKEIQEVYKEIAKMMEKIEKILDSEKKEILSEKENVSDQMSYIDSVINNL